MLNHLQVIAEHLSAEEVADIKQMFDKMDVNKNGKLTFEEFKAGLRKLGNQMHDSDLQILMDAVSYLLIISKDTLHYVVLKYPGQDKLMLLPTLCRPTSTETGP
jgi:Ca2+-binding EF-hand superfamily protein